MPRSDAVRRCERVLLASGLAVLMCAGLGPAAATESAAFPVTIENCGQTLEFDEPPSRVVTAYHSVFETLVALGLDEQQIIGRTDFSENGPDGFLPGQKQVYEAVPEVSPDIALPRKEALLALEPDFVISEGYWNFDASSGYATLSELTDAGIPAYITSNWCDAEGYSHSTIADIFDDIHNLGLIFGIPDRAAELTTELKGILADVDQRVADLEPVEVLATDGGSGPVNVSGGSGLTNQMIERAGGHNVLADLDEAFAQVSAERIATTNPEAMLVDDFDLLYGEAQPSAVQKAEEVFALIPDSPAARDRRFLPLPVVATHPGYRLVLEIRDIATFLHPQAFEAA